MSVLTDIIPCSSQPFQKMMDMSTAKLKWKKKQNNKKKKKKKKIKKKKKC